MAFMFLWNKVLRKCLQCGAEFETLAHYSQAVGRADFFDRRRPRTG
jgi:hypothetical protein